MTSTCQDTGGTLLDSACPTANVKSACEVACGKSTEIVQYAYADGVQSKQICETVLNGKWLGP
jgi:hypothetical protein